MKQQLIALISDAINPDLFLSNDEKNNMTYSQSRALVIERIYEAHKEKFSGNTSPLHTMTICIPKAESELYEKMLQEGPKRFVGINFTYDKSEKESSTVFEISTDNTILFCFIGKEYERRLMIYHLKNYSFQIHED